MKVLLTAASLDLSHGGPSENVPMLGAALARLGISVALAVPTHRAVHPVIDATGLRVYSHRGRAPRLRYPAVLGRAMAEFRPDIVHDNGVWLPENQIACLAAATMRTPLVVSPRGMLEPWALRYRGVRKRIAWLAYQRATLRLAAALIATSEAERRNVIAKLPGATVEVVPNGWDPPLEIQRSERVSPVRTALFFSRIHPKKGVELLLEAWAAVDPRDWQLKIVGPGEPAYVGKLKSKAKELRITNAHFLPAVYDVAEKNNVITSADVLVLPSYSENFGSVVVEALGLGVPVITTTGTPWEELRQYDCGWWVSAAVDEITAALRAATALTDSERERMGNRGRALVQKYSWDSVATRTRTLYETVLAARQRATL